MHAHRWSFFLIALALASACSDDLKCPKGSVKKDGACIESEGPGDGGLPDASSGVRLDGGSPFDAGPKPGTDGAIPTKDAAVPGGDGAAPPDAALGDGGTGCFADVDKDGHTNPKAPIDCGDGGMSLEADDCNDKAEDVNPDAKEICDGVDNDCDKKIDEGLTLSDYFADGDGDGHGAGSAMSACRAPAGHVASSDDCNDNDNSVFPGAPEACDSKDNNCVGGVDEAVVNSTYYLDEDGDGHGKPGTGVVDCKAPSASYVLLGDDCDDSCSTCAPGNSETLCDGKDDNCTGGIDEGLLNACGQCGPVPTDICDGLDNNCNGTKDDGFFCYKGKPGVACTTTCGTTGAGACSATCGAPTGAACTPPSEICNGQDDDCDSTKDDGFACVLGTVVGCTSTCGTSGTGACSASCTIPTGASCNPPNETCNNVDDDCDGLKDETYVCVQGATGVACTTSCGTTGTGTCTNACAIPAASACTPPAEICNNVDDDCDGLEDPNLVNKFTSVGETVYTQTGSGLNVGQVALLPRPAGGAWFMFRGFDDTALAAERDIRFRRLDAAGSTPTSLSSSITDGATMFAAETDGKWVVVLSRKRPTTSQEQDDTTWLRVQLFKASDLSFVSETIVLSHDDNDAQVGEANDADDCDDVRPLEVGVLEDANGNVHVATVYNDYTGALNGSSCTSSQKAWFQVTTYGTDGVWSLQTRIVLASIALGPAYVQIERIPCRSEWLVVNSAQTSSPYGWVSRRLSATGGAIASGLDTFSDFEGLGGFSRGVTDCNLAKQTMLLMYVTGTGGSTHSYIRRWEADTVTGAVSRKGDDILLPVATFLAGSAIQTGGRWFLTGVDFTAGKPRLWEVTVSNPAGEELREVALFTAGAGANPGNLSSRYGPFLYPDSSAVVDTGSAIVAGFPSAFTGNLDSYRASGDTTNPAAAVTYRLGCN